MAVRFRKYFNQCKPVQCGGRRSKHCPQDLPRKASGDCKVCGVWLVEMFDESKNWVSLSFADVKVKRDAEIRLSLLISDRERSRLNLPKKRAIPTLAEYGKKYLELYTVAKENTLAVKIRTVNTLTRYLGDYRLDKITPFLVERFRIDRKEKDKVKDGTINDDIACLNHILNKVIEDDIINKNPCNGIKKLKVEAKRDRTLTDGEISLLLNKLQGKNRLMILLGLFGGLRLNETLKLTWNDFDFQKALLTFVPSKTGKQVAVPLSDFIVGELNSWKNLKCTTNSNLFEDREVDTDVVKEWSKYFVEMFKQIGIHGFTYHCLRHTFASLQADLGTGAVTTKELLGHSSLDMTLRYSHTGLDSKRKAIDAMTAHVLNQGKILQPALQSTA